MKSLHPDTSPRAMRTLGLLLGAALVTALAACRPADDAAPVAATPPAPDAAASAVQPAPAPPGAAVPGATVRQSQWQCDNERVSARFDQAAQTVTVVHTAGELVLPQTTVSASGARYADHNGNEFWTSGAGGTLTLSGTPARACTEVANPASAPGG